MLISTIFRKAVRGCLAVPALVKGEGDGNPYSSLGPVKSQTSVPGVTRSENSENWGREEKPKADSPLDCGVSSCSRWKGSAC